MLQASSGVGACSAFALFSVAAEELLRGSYFAETSAGAARLLADLEQNRARRLTEFEDAYDEIVERLRYEVSTFVAGDLGFGRSGTLA